MELSLQAAFSTGGLVGNASYVLLIASMAMRDMVWLRCLAILSGSMGIAYDVVWLHDPVGAFWETCFTVTNLVQWLLLVRERTSLSLTADEELIWAEHFNAIPKVDFKRLAAESSFLEAAADSVIVRQGQEVTTLYLVLRGSLEIAVDGTWVMQCGQGDFLGEMSFLTGRPATATATTTAPCRLMALDRAALDAVVKTSESLQGAMNLLISSNLADKLARSNRHRASRAAPRWNPHPGPPASRVTNTAGQDPEAAASG